MGLLYNNKDIFISNYYLFKSERLFLWIFLLFVMILTGFKGYIDPDYVNYKFYFDLIPEFRYLDSANLSRIKLLTSDVELSVIYGMTILKSLGLGFQYYYIFTSLFFVFLIARLSSYFKGYECIVGLVIYCFYIQPLFIQVRYLVGVLCGLICLMDVYKNNKVTFRSLIYFFVGFLFHKVIIFIIPLVLLRFIWKYVARHLFIAFLLPCLFIIIPIDSVLQYTSLISDRYVNYLVSSSEQKELGSVLSFIVREVLAVAMLLLLFMANNYSFDKITQTKQSNVLIMILLAMLSTWALAWQFGMLYRIALLFEFGWVFFLIQKNERSINFAIFLILFMYMIIRLVTGLSELKPYEFAEGWAY
ncbi:EpsG family protein [Escherichia coli]|nr:EpsG family protein [Escherichia coli]